MVSNRRAARRHDGSGQVLEWSDPHGLVGRDTRVFLYFVRVTDDAGREYRYVGRTIGGRSRLTNYVRNVGRIFDGLPRRITPGQEEYRAVHLALAKACRHGWTYEFYALEEVQRQGLGQVERQRIRELRCNLNDAPKWRVEQFDSLTIGELIGEVG